eukprot:6205652-Pleurochrysis_carterae.AAC.1
MYGSTHDFLHKLGCPLIQIAAHFGAEACAVAQNTQPCCSAMQHTIDSQLSNSEPTTLTQPDSTMSASTASSQEPVTATVISELPPTMSQKVGRGTAIEVSQKALARSEEDWLKAKAKLIEVETEACNRPGVAKIAQKVVTAMKAVERALGKMQEQASKLKAAQDRAKERIKEMEVAEAKKISKQRELDRIILEDEGVTASDAAVHLCVRIRLKYDKKMANTSDTNEAVWKHVADEYNEQAAHRNIPGLPRSASSLQSTCAMPAWMPLCHIFLCLC